MDVLVINPHPGPNPMFVDDLVARVRALGARPRVVDGGAEGERHAGAADRVIVTGVPLDAPYSVSEPATQAAIERELGWLRDCGRPVLGICYGHQVLGHLYGGRIAAADAAVCDPEFELELGDAAGDGPFAGLDALTVFAEHRDYVAEVPPSFRVVSRRGTVPYIIHDPAARALGFQFVPELSGDDGHALLARFLG